MKVSISRNVVGFALLVLVMILSVTYEAMGSVPSVDKHHTGPVHTKTQRVAQ